MINVAICENEAEETKKLTQFLYKYANENGVTFNIRNFENGMRFLETFSSNYDVVFMDIDMPLMNGLETAKKLREKDSSVALIFVTNLAQYAINGYEYNAVDYILKPLNYPSFALKMNRVMTICNKRYRNEICIRTNNGEARFSSNQVIYVEINAHSIIYHTEVGDYNAYGTMKKVEAQFSDNEFVKCNSCYLVNLRYVSKIDGYTVTVGKHELLISRPRRKIFISKLHAYYGGGLADGQ